MDQGTWKEIILYPFLPPHPPDEEQVLEQMIRDTEEGAVEPEGEEEEEAEGQSSEETQEEVVVSEPGSPAALFEQFVARYVHACGSFCCVRIADTFGVLD